MLRYNLAGCLSLSWSGCSGASQPHHGVSRRVVSVVGRAYPDPVHSGRDLFHAVSKGALFSLKKVITSRLNFDGLLELCPTSPTTILALSRLLYGPSGSPTRRRTIDRH